MITEQQIEAAGKALIELGHNIPDGAIKCALEAAEQAAWQPIESIPDKLHVLVEKDGTYREVKKYSWCPNWKGQVIDMNGNFFNVREWRPLPEPPTEQEKG